jgi:hypothetical protein
MAHSVSPEQVGDNQPDRAKHKLGHLFGRHSVSTAEFEAVDPLGGILHPNWENRKAAQVAYAKRSRVRRLCDRIAARLVADEPNLKTYETQLTVDAEEHRNPPPLTAQQQKDIKASTAAFKDFVPSDTRFYEGILYPDSPPEDDESPH